MNAETYSAWDSAELLGDDEMIIEYLKAALEENDPRSSRKLSEMLRGPKA